MRGTRGGRQLGGSVETQIDVGTCIITLEETIMTRNNIFLYIYIYVYKCVCNIFLYICIYVYILYMYVHVYMYI